MSGGLPRPQIVPQAEAVCQNVHEMMLRLISQGLDAHAVLWGVASAVGNLAALSIDPEETLRQAQLGMRSACKQRQAMERPPAGSA